MRGEVEYIKVSIHAPRVGGDEELCFMAEIPDVSIHAPRVGGDAE